MLGDPSPLLAEHPSAAREIELKAAFVLSFARFIDWPEQTNPDPASPFRIAVLGSPELASSLSLLASSSAVRNRSLKIIQVDHDDPVPFCSVLYIAPGSADQAAQIMDRLQNDPVLTIGEEAGFLENGGMIRITRAKNTLGFEVHLAHALRAGLDIQAKLLRLAQRVYPEP